MLNVVLTSMQTGTLHIASSLISILYKASSIRNPNLINVLNHRGAFFIFYLTSHQLPRLVAIEHTVYLPVGSKPLYHFDCAQKAMGVSAS